MKNESSCKRILMLVENNSYPEDIRVLHEATALTEAGNQVSVICQARPNRPWREIQEGVFVFRYPLPILGKGLMTYILEYGYSLVAMFLLSVLVLIKPGFDYIHAANPPDTAVFIGAFYKIFGKRFIFDHHDLSPEIYQLRFGADKAIHSLVYRVLITLEWISCRLADHVIATNESYKAVEMERDCIPAASITVVRNGPDLCKQELIPIDQDKRPNGKIKLLYMGVIGFQDGVDYLLRSIFHLVHSIGKNNFCCVIAGDGDALPGLKSQALELGISDFVLFPGWIEAAQVVSSINSADICLAPEPSNPLNDRSTMIKIMEYMASGKPIVAFDLPEHRVTAQGAAIYVERNNELDFAQKIATIMDDPEKCNRMGQIGRVRIAEELSWAHQKIQLMNAYKKIEG